MPGVLQGFRKADPDQWEFANQHFVRGQRDALKDISRKKAAGDRAQQLTLSQPQPAIEVTIAQAGLSWQLTESLEWLKGSLTGQAWEDADML